MPCGVPLRVGGEAEVVVAGACRTTLAARVSARQNRWQGLPLPHEAVRVANCRPDGRRQPQRERPVTELTEAPQKYS
uniref:Uncharacterized protein n=2 Tax=unclassified Streptomyces TaxID=2593676 RepID=V9Z5L8_9ACTN|nr:hypothetical protein pFRL3_132c [Streptomyces sp. FR1]AHE39393.1 hypothetical protein pFRL4_160c [Streptomyces sp. F2]